MKIMDSEDTSHIFRNEPDSFDDQIVPIKDASLQANEESSIGVVFLSALLLLLSVILFSLIIYIIRRRSYPVTPPTTQKQRAEKIRLRYTTIERWLITKRAYRHTEFCEEIKQMLGQEEQLCHSHEVECTICFEKMTAGSIISWSANENCPHAFHHTCIKEWLLKHTSCPHCRNTFLLTDDYKGTKRGPVVVHELREAHARRAATTFYCEKDGLFVLPPTIRCSDRQKKELIERLVKSVVDVEELQKVRSNGSIAIPVAIEMRAMSTTSSDETSSPSERQDEEHGDSPQTILN